MVYLLELFLYAVLATTSSESETTSKASGPGFKLISVCSVGPFRTTYQVDDVAEVNFDATFFEVRVPR